MRRRLWLWCALAMLVAGAVGVVVQVNTDRGQDPPPLPLAIGAASAEVTADAATASRLAGPLVVYVPADDLPALGGDAPAYRLAGTGEDEVARLAAALGIDDRPVERDGVWRAQSDDLVLEVYGPEATWSAYRTAPPTDLPGAGRPGSGAASEPAAGAVAAACPSRAPERCDQPVVTIGPAPVDVTERPADLPTAGEAERIARDLLAAAGVDVDDSTLETTDGITHWLVTAEPAAGDLPAPGMLSSVTVGVGGRIESAFGYLGSLEEIGRYEMLDTRGALDRLNEVAAGSVVAPTPLPAEAAVAAADAASPATTPPQATIEPVEPPVVEPPVAEPQPVPLPTEPAPVAPSTTVAEPDPAGPRPGDPPTTAIEPAPVLPQPVEPAPPPAVEPTEVEVTGAEVALVLVPSWDGSGAYLVPGYRFTAADGSEPMIAAVVDDVLAPQPPPEPSDPTRQPGDSPGSAEPRTPADQPSAEPATIPSPAADHALGEARAAVRPRGPGAAGPAAPVP